MPITRAYSKKVKPDGFVGTKLVAGLEDETFEQFISDQNVALVMFYDPACPECQRSKPHFVKAAKTTSREGHTFAAVNCAMNPELCREQRALGRVPVFRLYAGGKYISDHDKVLDYQSIRQFVEDTPFFPSDKFDKK